MNRIVVILVLFALCCGAMNAQTYQRVAERNFWNESANVAGLRTDTLSISYAEVHASAVHGDFRDYSQARRGWSVGAEAHTIMHLPKASMAGRFSFDHTTGYDMCGSLLINPLYYPVDVLEFTPGRKDLQTYAFAGGFSYDLAPGWRVGAGIDFTSQNYAKRKDLRHSNYRLDFTVAPGFMYYGEDWSVGASYIFNKNSETATAEVVGSTVANYYAFLDKGLMYGVYELWSGSGVHLDESGVSGFPLREYSNGAALQVAAEGFFAEVKYLRSKGRVGEKQTIWFEFPSHHISAFAGYKFVGRHGQHFARFHVDWSRQKNNENVLGSQTENGITLTHVYGSNEIFERNLLSFAPEYQWIGKRVSLRGGVEVSLLDRLSSLMYPYIYRQSLDSEKICASALVTLGRFDLGVGVAFMCGGLDEEDENVDTEITTGEGPTQLSEYYNLQNEYLTATRLELSLSLRWNLPHDLYVEVATLWTHGFELKYIAGDNRWMEIFKFGYTF